MHRANYTKRNSDTGQQRMLKPEKDWVWTKVEPIVSEELWDQCNRLLGERRAKWKRTGKLPKSIFGGVTYCTCGKRMYVRSNTPKYYCTTCWNKIAMVDLEAIYYEQLKGFFLSPTELAEHLAKTDESLIEKQKLLRALEGEQAKLQGEVSRVYQLYVDQQLTSQTFGQFYRPLEERQKQLTDEVPRLQAEIDLLKVNNLSADRILTEAKDLYDRWPSLNREEKQRIVESITDKIIVGKDEITINLCCLPTSEEG
jgi:site-specific DNA recombinase